MIRGWFGYHVKAEKRKTFGAITDTSPEPKIPGEWIEGVNEEVKDPDRTMVEEEEPVSAHGLGRIQTYL